MQRTPGSLVDPGPQQSKSSKDPLLYISDPTSAGGIVDEIVEESQRSEDDYKSQELAKDEGSHEIQIPVPSVQSEVEPMEVDTGTPLELAKAINNQMAGSISVDERSAPTTDGVQPESMSTQAESTTDKQSSLDHGSMEEHQPSHMEAASMAEALKTALEHTPKMKPIVQSWKDLMQELYNAIFVKAKGPMSRLSEAAQRLPKLKTQELDRLIDLFELLVVTNKHDWKEWRQQVVATSLVAQRSNQALETLLWKSIGQEQVKKAGSIPQPLQGWISKVAGSTESNGQNKNAQKTFLFKTENFTPEQISHLRAICEKEYGKFAPLQPRPGTVDEWKIVQGLVEGHIVARRMPQFIKRIMKLDDQVRLVHTIRAQVEGCLTMDLRGESPIKEAFLSTRSIQESIATAATTRGAGSPELWKMVAQVKNISYNSSNHMLYFHFFTREAAKNYAGVKVPFHRYDHVLQNLHQERRPIGMTVWDKQVDENGDGFGQQGFYSCILKNVTRSVDLLKLTGFLRTILDMEFQLDDLDKGGPFSETSTLWELIVEADACPPALEGVRRILWCNMMIVVEHPTMKGRKQCLRCGEVGHPMRRCSTPLGDLIKTNCIQVTPAALAKLKLPAPTFRSMEELKEQVEKNRASQDKMEPDATEGPGPAPTEAGRDNEQTKQSNCEEEDQVTAQNDTSQARDSTRDTSNNEEDSWILVKNKNKKKQDGRPNGRKKISAEETAKEEKKIRFVAERNEADQGNKTPRKKTGRSNNKAAEEIVQKKNTVSLVSEGKLKKSIQLLIEEVQQLEGTLDFTGFERRKRPSYNTITSMTDMIEALSLRPVQTPATGNCQVYAVCQALASSVLSGKLSYIMEQLAGHIKEGSFERAMMDFDIKFPPGIRKQTLLGLGRGYPRISATESKKAFQQYFKEFAQSGSKLSDGVPITAWGSNDTLASISTLLQKDIYVISSQAEGPPGVLLFSPEVRKVKARSYAMSGEYPITLEAFIEKVLEQYNQAATKQDFKLLPIVLQFRDQHYSALLWGRRDGAYIEDEIMEVATSDDDDFDDVKMEASKEQVEETSGAENHHKNPHVSNNRPDKDFIGSTSDETEQHSQYSNLSPWDPDGWEGDMEDILERLDGPTIHHDLKCEINQILSTNDARMGELLRFLSETVTRLSLPEQEQLLTADLTDGRTRDIYMQRYGITEPILHQWVNKIWLNLNDSPPLLMEQAESGSEYIPTDASTSQDGVEIIDATEDYSNKRVCRRDQHVREPEHEPDHGTQRELIDDLVKSEEEPDKGITTEAECVLMWERVQPMWEKNTGINFPKATSTKAIWMRAAQQESNRILHLLKDVPGAYHILESIDQSVLVELTKLWREQCWLQMVSLGKVHGMNEIPARWFEVWESRYNQVATPAARAAIMISSQEWTRLRRAKYGGNQMLKLLAPKQMLKLARNLLCAHLFAEGLAALVSEDYHPVDSIVTMIQRHFKTSTLQPVYLDKVRAVENGQQNAWKDITHFISSEVPPKLTTMNDTQQGAHY